MNVCAITMVYRDYWALAQWIRHYSKELGIENLYIVAHGHDPKVNEIASGANIWTIPRDNLERFDRRRNKMLNQFQSGLLQFYDWVIRTDTDELICVDPDKHEGLKALLDAQTDPSIFALGLDLFEASSDTEMMDTVPLFHQRASVIVSGSYSKAWAIREDIPIMRHGVKIAENGKTNHSYALPTGVYLVHVKYASGDALLDANETRMELGNSGLPGMPGRGWEKAAGQAIRFLNKAEAMEVSQWDTATTTARDAILADMKFSARDGIVRPPFNPMMARTVLPDWFKDI